jgi:hypothetical protein
MTSLDSAPFKYSFFRLPKREPSAGPAVRLAEKPAFSIGNHHSKTISIYNKGELWFHFFTAVAYEQQ